MLEFNNNYLRREVGLTFETLTLENKLKSYQKKQCLEGHLQKRITELKNHPYKIRAIHIACGITFLIGAVALAALAVLAFIACHGLCGFPKGNPEALPFVPILYMPPLAAAGGMAYGAVTQFCFARQAVESLEVELKTTENEQTELKTQITQAKNELEKLKEALKKRNAYYTANLNESSQHAFTACQVTNQHELNKIEATFKRLDASGI